MNISFPEKCVCMIHLDIRSIAKNIEYFEAFMSNFDIEFTVMALSETWFNSSNDVMYNVDGYRKVCANRVSRRGGGVSLYVKMMSVTLSETISAFSMMS